MFKSAIAFTMLLAMFLGLALFSSTPAQAQNKQAISKSMMECSAIYDVLYRAMAAKGRPADQLAKVEQMALNFITAAATQAQGEGVKDVATYIEESFAPLLAKWEERFTEILTLPDTLEWIQYCGALANDRDILPE